MIKKKIFLILNEIFEIIHYFRQPLFRMGFRTAQQIKQLFMFLSFLIMSIQVLQISFHNQNFNVLKYYNNLNEEKTSQKFETFFLKSVKDPTVIDEYYNKREKIKKQLYQELSEKKKNFFDFYAYLEDNLTPEEEIDENPEIFNQIQNPAQKQETINIYRNFEQLNSVLFKDLNKQQNRILNFDKIVKEEEQYIIHLSADLPYIHWNKKRNYNFLTYNRLLNWKFNDSDLQIRDLKKEDALDKAHNIVKKIYSQYQTFLNKDIKEEFHINELQRIFLYANDKEQKEEELRIKNEKYFIRQKKVFIETEFTSNAEESIFIKFLLSFIDPILEIFIQKELVEYEQKIYEKKELQRIQQLKELKEFLTKRKERLEELKKKDEILLNEVRYSQNKYAPNSYTLLTKNAFLEAYTKYQNSLSPLRKLEAKLFKFLNKHRIFELIYQLLPLRPLDFQEIVSPPPLGFPSKPSSEHPCFRIDHDKVHIREIVFSARELEERRENPKAFQREEFLRQYYEIVYRIYKIILKKSREEQVNREFPISAIAKIFGIKDILKKDADNNNDTNDIFLESKIHKKILAEFKAKIPPSVEEIREKALANNEEPFENKLEVENSRNWRYYIRKLNDQIPRKLQGLQKREEKVLSPGERLLSAADNWYQPQKYEVITYKKSDFDEGVKKISEIRVEAPKTYPEYCERFEKKKAYFSLKGIELLPLSNSKIKNYYGLKNFLTLLVETMKVDKFSHIFKKKFLNSDILNKIFGSWGILAYNLLPELPEDLSKFYFLKPEEPEYDSIKAAKRIKKNLTKFIPLHLPVYIDKPYKFTKLFFDQLISLEIEENKEFQEWRKKQIKEEFFDAFQNRFSPILKKKEQEPHLNLLINAEDYLLEAIFNIFEIKRLKLRLQEIDEIREMVEIVSAEYDSENFEDSEDSEEYEEEDKERIQKIKKQKIEFKIQQSLMQLFFENKKVDQTQKNEFIYPTEVTEFILNFLNFRKNQRNLLFERINALIQRKLKLKELKNIKTLKLKDFYLNDLNSISLKYLDKLIENQIFPDLQLCLASKKYDKYDYLFGLINTIPHYFLPIKSNFLSKKLSSEIYFKKYLLEIQKKLINIFQFILLELEEYNNSNCIKKIPKIPPIPFEEMNQFLLNLQNNKQNEIYEILLNFFKFKLKNWLFYLNDVSFINIIPQEFYQNNKIFYYFMWLQKYVLPNESLTKIEDKFMQYFETPLENIEYIPPLPNSKDEISFRRKLPRIPETLDFGTYLICNLNFESCDPNRDKYPYQLANLEELNKLYNPAKFKLQKILKNQYNLTTNILKNQENEIQLDLDLNNIIGNNENLLEYLYKFFYLKFGEKFYELENFYKSEDSEDSEEEKEEKEEKEEYSFEEYFQKFFQEKITDIFHHYSRKTYLTKKLLDFPIFKNSLTREMSGYFYPDFSRTKNMRKILITEIPVNNKKYIEVENKRTGELNIISFDSSNSNSNKSKIFKNLGLFFSHEIYEFREEFNKYSWSIFLFLSSGVITAVLIKNVFLKYAQEILESSINLLYYTGILNDKEWIKQELRITTPVKKGYRDIQSQTKKLANVRGLNYILLKLNEMIYFLKITRFRKLTSDPFINYCISRNEQIKQEKSFSDYSKPKGFLFNGPPGTGKTLLVQAILGESGVPVVTQSGGLLKNNPKLQNKGPLIIHKLFKRARVIAPCIIFIDELDGIGTRRYINLTQNSFIEYDIIEFLENYEEELIPPPKIFQPKIKRKAEFLDDHATYWKEPEFTQTLQSYRNPIDVLQKLQSTYKDRNEQIDMLIQLLIELDGIRLLDNIIVIGATNRIDILDPALMRPGRFQYNFEFYLPNYDNRIDLLKFYTISSKIGTKNISWDYFSKRTNKLSSADIASIIFASELIAIKDSTPHTFESLERGIELITSLSIDPIIFRLKNIFIYLQKLIQTFFSKNNFYFLNLSSRNLIFNSKKLILIELSNVVRSAYYNIGKMFIGFYFQPKLQLLSFDPYINLWEREKNFRFIFFTKNFNEFVEFEQKRIPRNEIEKRFLTFFGGKVGESLFLFLPLQKFSMKKFFKFHPIFVSFDNILEQSNFEIENEIQMSQDLLKLITEKWHFYSEKIVTEMFHPIFENSNLKEYFLDKKKELFLSQVFFDEMVINLDMRNRLSKNEQKHSYKVWWLKKIATQSNYIENRYHLLEWSRIYLSSPKDSIQNIEWVSPDIYFHTVLRTPPYCMAWSHFLENRRFTIQNSLSIQAFNILFRILRQFSEFIDFLSDYLLRSDYLTEKELESKLSQFYILFKEKIS